MKLLPISLGLHRQRLGVNKARSGTGTSGLASGGFGENKGLTNELKQKIFARDDNTCQYCGFKAKKYQDVVFANSDHNDFSEENLNTACSFCHQCFNLDAVSAMRSGVLLWLPEVTQADLHHIARAVYVARISQGPMAEVARKILDIIMQRRTEVRTRIGTDDPYILATVLKDYLTSRHYSRRDEKISGIRLFPLDRRIIKEADLEFNQFPQILAYWRSKAGPFGGKTPQKWFDIYQDVLKTV